ERDLMALADRLDLAYPFQDGRLGGRVVVHGAGDGAGGEDAGVVGPAHEEADAALLAERQEGLQRLLFEQRIAAGQEEAVEVARLRQLLAAVPLVEAGADSADGAALAQLHHRLVAALQDLLAAAVGGL